MNICGCIFEQRAPSLYIQHGSPLWASRDSATKLSDGPKAQKLNCPNQMSITGACGAHRARCSSSREKVVNPARALSEKPLSQRRRQKVHFALADISSCHFWLSRRQIRWQMWVSPGKNDLSRSHHTFWIEFEGFSCEIWSALGWTCFSKEK